MESGVCCTCVPSSHRKGKASLASLAADCLHGLSPGYFVLPSVCETYTYCAQDDGLIHIHDPEMHFCNDLAPEDAKNWAAQLVVHPTSAQWTNVTHEAFRAIPVTYLLCENDQALPLEVQKMMCGRIEALGVKVDYETCSAGHSPFLSMPDELAKIISKVAEV